MKRSELSAPDSSFRANALITAIAVLVAAACLQAIDYLHNSRVAVTQTAQDSRNASASALYVQLASLPQSSTHSSITRTIHDFMRQNTTVDGVTLLDENGQLVAHLGNGNDTLLNKPEGKPSARIPIHNDARPYGHAIVVFHANNTGLEAALHYFTLAAVVLMLVVAVIRLLMLYANIAISTIRRLPDVAQFKK